MHSLVAYDGKAMPSGLQVGMAAWDQMPESGDQFHGVSP